MDMQRFHLVSTRLVPDGYYEITITSSNNNVFEGYFNIE